MRILFVQVVFLTGAFLLMSGCTTPSLRIQRTQVVVSYKKVTTPASAPASVQVQTSRAWPPGAPLTEPIQIGSPNIVPPPRSVAPAPLKAPEPAQPQAPMPPVLKTPPPEVKKQEVKIPAKEKPKKEFTKPKKEEIKKSSVHFLSRFDNIDWNDTPKPNMKMIGDENDTQEPSVSAYTIDNDFAPAFGLRPGMIIYYFKFNRFQKVEIIWEPNETEYSMLEDNVLSVFGKPVEEEVLGSRHWINADPFMAVRFSDANALKESSSGRLMSLMIEKLEQ